MGFDRIEETHHTGQVIARWKKALYEAWDLVGAVGLATEDGASNNKTANRILGQEYKVCMSHDLARGVMHAIGETKKSKNPELKGFVSRAGKQSAAFSRSVVANHELQQYQLDADSRLKAHATLSSLRPTETATIARYMLKYAKGISAAPSSTSPDPSSSDAAASAAPSSGSAGPSTSGHAADPPSADPLGGADMSLLQRAGVLQNTPYDA
mmetsp:Transcript_38038/g.119448  ORF Transcript_38038/g.119448 Transcript_38038/m.119448 type:complete len:211 (+) Transcript_38038:603-1235(+)